MCFNVTIRHKFQGCFEHLCQSVSFLLSETLWCGAGYFLEHGSKGSGTLHAHHQAGFHYRITLTQELFSGLYSFSDQIIFWRQAIDHPK